MPSGTPVIPLGYTSRSHFQNSHHSEFSRSCYTDSMLMTYLKNLKKLTLTAYSFFSKSSDWGKISLFDNAIVH